MKLKLRVTPVDGEPYEVSSNLYVIVAWERKFKRKSSELANSIGHEDLLFLAWEAAKQCNIPVQPSFDEFIKKVEDIDVVSEQVPPTEAVNTPSN